MFNCDRMEWSGVYFLMSIALLSVLAKEFSVVNEAKVGLAMTYTLQLTGAMILWLNVVNVS